MAWEDLAGGALGGAIVSAGVGLLAQGRDRRVLRVEVLKAVSVVERARWASTPWSDFRAAVQDLRAAALIAGANRRVAERYITLAQVARSASETSYTLAGNEIGEPGEDAATGISSTLADLVADAAQVLVDELWRPWRAVLVRPLRMRRLDKKERSAKAKLGDERPRIDWDPFPIR